MSIESIDIDGCSWCWCWCVAGVLVAAALVGTALGLVVAAAYGGWGSGTSPLWPTGGCKRSDAASETVGGWGRWRGRTISSFGILT